MGFGFGGSQTGLNVEVVCIAFHSGELQVAFVARGSDPYRGRLELPTTELGSNERLAQSAARVVKARFQTQARSLARVGIFDKPDRDPRGRVLGVAYVACLGWDRATLPPNAEWVTAEAIVDGSVGRRLAFDHQDVARAGLRELARLSREDSLLFGLLPDQFSLTDAQSLYEQARGAAVDKRNFRRKLEGFGVLKDTGKRQRGVPHRAAKLYAFDGHKALEFAAGGGTFDL